MKRLHTLLAAFLLLPFLSPGAIHVYKGGSSSGTCLFTYDKGKVRTGKSTTSTILYVFQGRKIWEGTTASGNADYAIDNSDRLYKGASTSGTPILKLASNKIHEGGSTGGKTLFNLSGRTFREGSSSGGKALHYLDGNDTVPAELLFLLAILSDASGSGGEDGGLLKVYRGNYTSGAPVYTLKGGHLFRGQFASGASAYTFDGSKIYEGNYASGAPDYVHDGQGRFYIGQYASGAPDYRYDNGKVYRGQYISGAADFIVKGDHLYRGQYASGAAAYTFSGTMAIPASLIYFLTAIVEDAADVRTETPGIVLAVEERLRIREQVGGEGTIVVKGGREEIDASLALGIRPEVTASREVTFRRPALRIASFQPVSGEIALLVRPGAGCAFDPGGTIRAEKLHVHAARTLEGLATNPDRLPVASVTQSGPGAATLRLALPAGEARFLRLAVTD